MSHDVRKGTNEVWFREVNERLEDRAAVRPGSDEQFEIVCECVREECTERIAISFSDYEAVRAKPKAFIVVSGHTDPTCERLISSAGTYNVVEKFGDAALIAEVENPRNGEGEFGEGSD